MNWELLLQIVGWVIFILAIVRLVNTWRALNKLNSVELQFVEVNTGKEWLAIIILGITGLVYYFGS